MYMEKYKIIITFRILLVNRYARLEEREAWGIEKLVECDGCSV